MKIRERRETDYSVAELLQSCSAGCLTALQPNARAARQYKESKSACNNLVKAKKLSHMIDREKKSLKLFHNSRKSIILKNLQ